MTIETPYGTFEGVDFTRVERRKHLKEMRTVWASNDSVEQMDYCDKFALAIFDGEKGVDEALKGLSAVEEDDVLIRLVCGYMGVDVDKAGDIVEKQIGD